MILSLSHSPDAQQGRGMASHGQGERVQYGTRPHSAPEPQGTPSYMPTTSPTTASEHSQPDPPQHTQGAHARHNRDHHMAPRAPWLAQRRAYIPSRAPTSLQPAGAATKACRVMHSPQPAAELRTSKQGEKRAWGGRAPSGRIAFHALASAPGVGSSHNCKPTRQYKPPGGRPTLWRRTDGALSAAASPAVARARSKAHELAMQRLPRQVSVREAAYI